jgi:hypothetical protein
MVRTEVNKDEPDGVFLADKLRQMSEGTKQLTWFPNYYHVFNRLETEDEWLAAISGEDVLAAFTSTTMLDFNLMDWVLATYAPFIKQDQNFRYLLHGAFNGGVRPYDDNGAPIGDIPVPEASDEDQNYCWLREMEESAGTVGFPIRTHGGH